MQKKYYHTLDTAKEYIKMAEGYDGKEIIDKLTPHLSPQASILELGSGPGVDLKILAKTFKVTRSDFSPVFIKLLQEKKEFDDLLILDAKTIDTERSFDCIYSNKVLHHLTDEELNMSIWSQVKTLNDNGIVCHSFWKGDKEEEKYGLYFNYHTEENIKKMFSKFFKVVLIETYTELEKDDSILLIAQKNNQE